MSTCTDTCVRCVLAYIVGLYSYGLYSSRLYSYGLFSYNLYAVMAFIAHIYVETCSIHMYTRMHMPHALGRTRQSGREFSSTVSKAHGMSRSCRRHRRRRLCTRHARAGPCKHNLRAAMHVRCDGRLCVCRCWIVQDRVACQNYI